MSASSSRVPVVRAKAACHVSTASQNRIKCLLTKELDRLVNVGVKFMGDRERSSACWRAYAILPFILMELRASSVTTATSGREYRQLLDLVQRGGPPAGNEGIDFLITNSRSREEALQVHQVAGAPAVVAVA